MESHSRYNDIKNRIQNKVRRLLISNFAQRTTEFDSEVPYISFTFDDFPRSAVYNGSKILAKHGAIGTFYVSMGLLAQQSPSGEIATKDDILQLIGDGHEIGCHTFDHLDGALTMPKDFVQSLQKNRKVFKQFSPKNNLETFAYPLDGPTLCLKKLVGEYFLCCRGGGQTFNARTIDLNLLKSYFLDYRVNGDIKSVERMIDENNLEPGWLIFSTHDVIESPSKYGCTPQFFEQVVQFATDSGAKILPVEKVCREILNR